MTTHAARLIDGKGIAEAVRAGIRARVAGLAARGKKVRLDAVLAAGSGDAASRVYAENQAKMCRDLGIEYELHDLPQGSDYDDIAGRVLLLGRDDGCHAIMVHMPLPEGVDPFRVQSLIDPDKDVEGVNPANIGNIVYGRSSLAPCTALAVMKLIDATGLDLRGKTAAVVGASNIVGKPVAVMLMQREATVLSLNKFTPEITRLTGAADVVVAAAGVPGLVKAEWIKPGAVVIDVGIHRVTGADGKAKTVGDVDAAAVVAKAGWISPVPGGVGPVTVAMLLENVVSSAERG
ncbi:MAG: bifunctional 5,10-methylenetetrahydrofolate dehydrogenase/5,10-methenyltetrahydrofolate cyclohydrolase [Phycisphaerales bacterium]